MPNKPITTPEDPMSTLEKKATDTNSVVLAGVDFSDSSREVLRTAAALAKTAGRELHFVHILPPPAIDMLAVSPADRGLGTAERLEQTKKALDELALEIVGTVKRIVGHIRVGKPDLEIAQLASDLRADLIVVGTHGKRGLDRLLLGSVAESLVRHAPCPVLTYRPKVSAIWEQIAPPCPDCVRTQEETQRARLWCERHSERHPRAHTYSEVPESYGIGAQTFR
jgi:nucleotide-binding universal stress UspA family protein